MEISPFHKQAKTIRIFRKVHKIAGICLFVFIFFVAITGILLGWKKNSGGFLLTKSISGTSSNFTDWLPLDSLHTNACKYLHTAVSANLSTELERIDIRKDKGMAKFIFANHYWAVQVDGATGKLLQIEQRRADFIENVHDGSILDKYFGTKNEPIKLLFTSLSGLALLIFTITGFWIWLGTKRLRTQKINRKNNLEQHLKL